jgi:thioredoxin-related protein
LDIIPGHKWPGYRFSLIPTITKKQNKIMKQMKRLMCAILLMPLLMHAQTQEEGKGIHWTTGLSWEQIKQKAKSENKYIFIDAYTTWCGPCKMMDKYVYSNDTVGDFFNRNFIAVKAQMDKTENDEQTIIDWYKDAKKIQNDYSITAYPSLIFLSPQSSILYKIEGYRPVQPFVDTAKLVLTNGTVYNDPYKEYRNLVTDYKQGIKHYDRMPYMIGEAVKLFDTALARQLFKEHLEYVSGLNETERYTKENIKLWSSFLLKLDSKALQFFLKDSIKIDKVMGQRGFSASNVNKTIQGRIVDSFFRMQMGMTTTITGQKVPNSEIMFMWLPGRKDGKIEPDYVEADWKKLKKMIREYFGESYATRNVNTAKMRWYGKHQNMTSYMKTYFDELDKYPPTDLANWYWPINESAWETFLYANDKELLKKALEWMDKIIQHGANSDDYFDTYANLLYKLGRTKEAIEWEEKAVKLNPNEKTFSMTLEKIKKGEPTYIDKGAIWTKE